MLYNTASIMAVIDMRFVVGKSTFPICCRTYSLLATFFACSYINDIIYITTTLSANFEHSPLANDLISVVGTTKLSQESHSLLQRTYPQSLKDVKSGFMLYGSLRKVKFDKLFSFLKATKIDF